MFPYVLFDLDGTLTDSGEGITKSVQYALEKVGKPEPDLQKLRIFVGPPLLEQFQECAVCPSLYGNRRTGSGQA